jgi:hypothetical protein
MSLCLYYLQLCDGPIFEPHSLLQHLLRAHGANDRLSLPGMDCILCTWLYIFTTPSVYLPPPMSVCLSSDYQLWIKPPLLSLHLYYLLPTTPSIYRIYAIMFLYLNIFMSLYYLPAPSLPAWRRPHELRGTGQRNVHHRGGTGNYGLYTIYYHIMYYIHTHTLTITI